MGKAAWLHLLKQPDLAAAREAAQVNNGDSDQENSDFSLWLSHISTHAPIHENVLMRVHMHTHTTE